MGSVTAIRREYEQFGIRATSVFPAGTFPQVPIDDPKMYPIYATCVELTPEQCRTVMRDNGLELSVRRPV